MPDDRELFDKAEANLRQLRSQLQINFDDLMTVFLLILARDLSVPLPDVFSGLTTNYAAFLAGTGDFNDEKQAINAYLGRVLTDEQTFQYVLITKIIAAREIASITPVVSVPLPSAPYVAPLPKKPNPPPVTGLAITLSASALTGTVGGSITLTATVVVPPGRAVTRVEFYDGATLLGQDTTTPYNYTYSLASQGTKTLAAKAYDDSPSPVVSVSNAVSVIASDGGSGGGSAFSSAFSSAFG